MEDQYNSIFEGLKSPTAQKSVSKKEDTPKIDEGVKEIYKIARKKIKTLKRDHELEKREFLNYKKSKSIELKKYKKKIIKKDNLIKKLRKNNKILRKKLSKNKKRV